MPAPLATHQEPIPGYRLIERLGRGGFGEVWKVEAPGGLMKAIKFVFGDLNDSDDENIRAAEQEKKAMERVKTIRHPYILSLERYDIIDGQLMIVMELADCNLWDRFRECRGLGMVGVPREELLRYMEEAAEALDLMNDKYHIQHLDVKPQNLFLVSKHIKVADFGLAKMFEGCRGTITGGVTPVYAGPETFEGYVSRFTDQYSLAIVFQELLTGTRPFNGSNTKQLVMQHLNGVPDLDALPAADRPHIARSLAKKPDERWPSCTELIRALRHSTAIDKAPTPPRTPMPAAPRPTVAELGATRNLAELGNPRPRPALSQVTPSRGPASRTPHPHNTTGRLGSTQLVTPQAANANTFQNGPPQNLTITLQRPIVVQTAKMNSLGLAPPAREENGVILPALIVGIGHSGMLAIRVMKRMIRERFGPEPLPHIRFLAIDTDPESASLAVSGKFAGDPLSVTEIVTARLNRSTHYLQRDGIPPVEQWLPPGILYKLPRDPAAASGVRAYGRLALVDNYRMISQRIRSEIETFLSDEPIDKATSRTGLGMASNRARAYVIAGTAGGTGGGMFLDMAYIIKNEFRQIGYVRPETVGVLIVPPADRTVAKGHALANTFGALTELHHFHQGRSRYTVRFDNAEPSITDGDGPFSRCGLVQSGNRNTPTEQSKTAGLIARTLYLDLFTTTGRTIDSIRKEAFDLNREGVSVVQSTGVYRINWPRTELLTTSTRSFAQRLIQRWTAKDASHLREPIQTWLDDQWQKRNLELEVVVGGFEKAIKDALREEPERVFQAFVDPLRQRTPGAGRFDAEAAIAVLEQILNVVGKPEHESDKVGTLKAVLDRRGKTLATEAEGHLSAMAVSFIEQPQYRMPGTEEVLSQITERLKRTIDGLTGVRTGLVREVWDTYSRIFPVIGNLSGGLGMIGTRKATVTSELFDLFQSYPTKRLKLLVLDATLAIYRSLLSSVPEYTREVGMCRARLVEISQSFTPTEKPIPFHSGPGRMILPQGVEGVDGAADQFLASLSSKEILDFDSGLQQEIAKRFRSLVNVCVKPEYAPSFATLLMTQSHAFLDMRLERSDPAAVLFRSRDVGPGTDKMLIQAFEGAAPDLTSVSGKPQMEATILACPLGPNGDRFRDLVEATLPGIGFIPAVLSDDIAFIREYPLLPLNEVPQLAGHAREAYAAQLAAENSPHTRTDITWPSVGTP